MKDHLIFDTTDAGTMADTDSVGAYIRASDGTLIGHVSDALKVNFSNTTIDVTATNLDIRDLVFATDKVDISGSTLAANSGVDIGDVTINNAAGASAVNIQDGGNSITVDASQLDIDDLDYSADNVAIKGDTGNQLVVNADGSINVNADISVTTGSDKAEDSASSDGDIGTFILGIRQDTLTNSVSADGDYAALKVNASGALYVDAGNVSVNDAALADTAIISKAKALAIADTAESIITSALANRKYLWVYNNHNTKVYLGGSGVTDATGFPLTPGSYMELRAGASMSPFFVGQSGKTPDIRTMEIS